MEITATVKNSRTHHEVTVRSGDTTQTLSVPPKTAGKGSAVNGGEFLMLALATCYCNDLYREADTLGIPIEKVEVEATARFAGIGVAATDIRYRANVTSPAPHFEISKLLRHTDAVAEVQNTLRSGVAVELVER